MNPKTINKFLTVCKKLDKQLVTITNNFLVSTYGTTTVKYTMPKSFGFNASVNVAKLSKLLPTLSTFDPTCDGKHLQLENVKLPASEALEFPVFGSSEVLGSYTNSFADDLEFVSRAVSTDDTRLHLYGVFLSTEDMVATDGHRMHKAICTSKSPMFLPNEILALLKPLLKIDSEYVRLEKLTGSYYRIVVGKDQQFTIEYVSKYVDEQQFPPYHKVIPTDPEHKTVVTSKVLQKCIKQAKAVFVPTDTFGTKANIIRNGHMKLVDNSDCEENPAEIICELKESDSQEFKFGLCLEYLNDTLIDDEIIIQNNGELDPIRIDYPSPNDHRLAVIMPIRL